MIFLCNKYQRWECVKNLKYPFILIKDIFYTMYLFFYFYIYSFDVCRLYIYTPYIIKSFLIFYEVVGDYRCSIVFGLFQSGKKLYLLSDGVNNIIL